MKRTFRISLAAVFYFLLIAYLSGCKHYTVHPGAASVADSKAYDSLLVAHAAIEQAKIEYRGGAVKIDDKYINDAVAAYNIARASYLTFHDAALAGGNTAQLELNLAHDLANLTSVIAALEKQLGVRP